MGVLVGRGVVVGRGSDLVVVRRLEMDDLASCFLSCVYIQLW